MIWVAYAVGAWIVADAFLLGAWAALVELYRYRLRASRGPRVPDYVPLEWCK